MRYDYDVVVIGGGAAGLVASTGAASLGAKTAMIEKNKLGGDCTWYGCIPSKTLLKSARVLSIIKDAQKFGISAHREKKYDAAGVLKHVRDTIKRISLHHPVELFQEKGIDVFFGTPKFIDKRNIELNNKKISAKRFIIATGSHPIIPNLEGLETVDFLTNENIFDLQAIPESLAILGAGPIGIELSQAFSRLGSKVYIIEACDRILPREDEETSKILSDTLKSENIEIFTGRKALRFTKEAGSISIELEDTAGKNSIVKAEKILVAVGRAANIEGLGLEKAGVKYSKKAIEVDSTLKTTADNIYACGDCCGPYQFSHMAEYQAIIALGNALFPFKRRVDYNSIPWCTFTDPELAHLGLTEEEAKTQHKNIFVYRSQYKANDRAVTESEETGMAKVITDKKGRILGAHIAGSAAGEIIHEYVLAKSAKLKIGKLSSAIHIYPTLAQIVKRSADQRLLKFLDTPAIKSFSGFLLKFLR